MTKEIVVGEGDKKVVWRQTGIVAGNNEAFLNDAIQKATAKGQMVVKQDWGLEIYTDPNKK